MSYNTVRIKIEDGNDVIVRGPFDVLDGGLSYEAFQVAYSPGNPPDSFEFEGCVYERRDAE